MERDHLVSQRNELQDLVGRLEKKKEGLLRDNEKLKNDTRVTRKSINLTGTSLSSNVLLSRNASNKLRPNSPGGSVQLKNGLNGIDKNLIDITNYSSGLKADSNSSTKGSTLSRSGTTTSINSDEDTFMN